MNISIRIGTPDDAEAAAEIAALAWKPVYEGYRQQLGDDIFTAVFSGWENAKKTAVRAAFAPIPDRGAFVAEEDGRTVGFITYAMNRETGVGTILNNAVAPASQGRGIATMMYTRVLDAFRECGMKAATVSTGGDAAHVSARRAYEKAGFSEHLRSVTYYQRLD